MTENYRSPQDADRAAIAAKFKAEIGQHTLDDINGKAPAPVRQALRSDAHVEAWHLEILRLLANTPRGNFWDKLDGRRIEAKATLTASLRKRHDLARTGRPLKTFASGANIGQMAAMILAAHIKAGTPSPVAATVTDIHALAEELKSMEQAT